MTETQAISEAAKKAAINLGFSRRGGVAKRIQRAINEATERLRGENACLKAKAIDWYDSLLAAIEQGKH